MSEDPQKPDSSEALSRLFGSIVKEGKSLADEVSGNAKAVARSALGNLDVVSRDEFDAQTAVLQRTVLQRTRLRVEQLESEIDLLLRKVEALEKDQ
jgi:BMFP domain-containing protein YqiC